MKKDNDHIEYEDDTRIELGEDDSPELTEAFFKKARPAHEILEKTLGKASAEKLLKGKVGRPVSDSPKKQITLRLDADVIEEFRSHGKGWQTEINHVLREWVDNRPQL
jgi:uncharacterized protein (DUF4415 family)